ncbi:hypothetical protein ACJX0J_001015 [Zea mays]
MMNLSKQAQAYRQISIKAMKQVAGKSKLELAQFAELQAFAQFASALDKTSQNQLARGRRLRELLKQSQSNPLPVEEQVATIYTGTRGYLDSLEIEQVKKFLDELRKHLKDTKPQFQEIISSSKTFTEQAETLLKEAIQEQLERMGLLLLIFHLNHAKFFSFLRNNKKTFHLYRMVKRALLRSSIRENHTNMKERL